MLYYYSKRNIKYNFNKEEKKCVLINYAFESCKTEVVNHMKTILLTEVVEHMKTILLFVLSSKGILLIIFGLIVLRLGIMFISKYFKIKLTDRSNTRFFNIMILIIVGMLFVIFGAFEIPRDITKSKLPIGKFVKVIIDYGVINKEVTNGMSKYNIVLLELKDKTTKAEVVRTKDNSIIYFICLKNGEIKRIEAEILYNPYFKTKEY